ncbi:hypothetical protein PpBr36_01796 [Pyricularia pennisetigena]|uniref:hypothetical protein n=1 Tax=Pyricularia pennisetigena TaxID=1578925 RepID=UPI001154CD51|nr:hypothetical protein PpBr36_01796 [Pyricularia pennisetigena]TLS28290.1 hypothetical protein PpBr36_01796 [Pyricularia pennisetigena]
MSGNSWLRSRDCDGLKLNFHSDLTPTPSPSERKAPRHDVKAGLRHSVPRHHSSEAFQRQRSATVGTKRTVSFSPRTSSNLLEANHSPSPSPSPKDHGNSNYILKRAHSPPASSMNFLGIKSQKSPPRRYFSPPLLSPGATETQFGILSPNFRPASVSSIASLNLSSLDDEHGIEYPAEPDAPGPLDQEGPDDVSPTFDLSTIRAASDLLDVSKVAPGYKGVVADSTWRVLHYLITGAGDNLDVTDLQAIHENILAIHEIVGKKCPPSWPRRPLKHTLGLYPSMTSWKPMREAFTDSEMDDDAHAKGEQSDDGTEASVLNRAEISRIAEAASGLEEYVESHTPSRTPSKVSSPKLDAYDQLQSLKEAVNSASDSLATPKPRTPAAVPSPDPPRQPPDDVAALVVAEAEKLCVQLESMAKSLYARRQELDHIYESFVEGQERNADRMAGLQQHVDELEEDVRENESELTHLRLQLRAIELQIPERSGEDRDPELTESIDNWKAEFETVKSRWRERRSRNSSFRTTDDSSMTSTAMTTMTINSSPIRITRGSSMTSSFRLSRGSSLSSPMGVRRCGE